MRLGWGGLRVACAGGLFVSVVGMGAQEAKSTLKVESQLIETTMIVRDASGSVVTNLRQDQVSVTEDGVAQRVRYFAGERELPLSIGLIVDASGSQEKFVKEHQKAIEGFLREVLEPRDQAFAVCFGNHLRLTSDWTSAPGEILEGLHKFEKGEPTGPEIGPEEDRELGTALYDAVYFSVMEKLQGMHGRRKVLLVLSDGEENSSEHDLMDAIGAAQNGDVLVYAVRTTELEHGRMNARDRYGMRVLDHLTEETGGRSFDAGTTKLTEDFATIAEELRSLYEVGYYSSNHRHDGRFRKVVIETTEEGQTVRARSGYRAGRRE
jgi:Ca-activated chloride channel family protein